MKNNLKKKIIIQTGSLRVGGQEKMLSELLKVINPEKYKVLLLIEEDCGNENIYEKNIPEYIEYEFLTSKKFMEKLEKYKKSKNPFHKILYSLMLKSKKKIAIKNFKKYLDFGDIIIDYNLGLLRYCNKLNLKGKKLIGWSHAGLGGRLKDKRKEKNRKFYSHIITINEEMRRCYQKNTNQYGIKIHKIHNFLDEKIIIEKSKEKIKENLGKYIISVGALTENKNNISLIYAFKKLVDKGIDENLVILGEGKERENLEKAIKNLNLSDRVKLLGIKENPYKYIRESTLFVQCSYSEGFPLVLLESMIIGKAVVSTENYGSKEILEDGKYGLIVENNIDKISEGIYSLIINGELKKKKEELSLKRGKEFSLEAGRKKIEEFIESI
ncbi:glycosyltransferase [Candidatus Cetobacterium colombiensis]|uniref:Glycosyltransferase n=1 Tax=Candidatus Cetobacterium colombiensis TaxID=3073100 RepID=A0ABU4W8R9_9FUSO|nr:glycosyltransferase [Candidatus Cetobacterium colombiensis]MDX8335922.1 glycosyltransferase [Candidatus Cetobacterium colombiensis]